MMAEHKPTIDQQRRCYNHFKAILAEKEGQSFTPIADDALVAYGNKEILADLIAINGRKCMVPLCRGYSQNFILEHIDGNKENYDPLNLRIGCKSCNQKEHKHQVPYPSGNTGKLEKELAGVTKSASVLKRAEAEAIARTAPIFKKSKDYKRQVRIYMMQVTAGNAVIDRPQLRADIIALTGMSRNKADEYIDDFTESKFQPFECVKPDDPNTPIKRREKVDYSKLPEEDRRIYEEAQGLINQETAAKLEQEREEVRRAAFHTEALRVNERIYRQVGQWVDTDQFKIRPIVYVSDPKKYESDGINGPQCLRCGNHKTMTEGQLVCKGCEMDLKGGNGKAGAAA